jgi:hypothetical protein
MQSSPGAADTGRPSSSSLQFYSIELTPLADGKVFVGVNATLCEDVGEGDFELSNMQMVSAHAATIDDALVLVRNAVSAS